MRESGERRLLLLGPERQHDCRDTAAEREDSADPRKGERSHDFPLDKDFFQTADEWIKKNNLSDEYCELFAFLEYFYPSEKSSDFGSSETKELVAGCCPLCTKKSSNAEASKGPGLEEVYTLLNLPLDFVPFRSHSDGNLFYQAGTKPVILGPGSLETAHTAEERTTLAEVEAAARIYAALALG